MAASCTELQPVPGPGQAPVVGVVFPPLYALTDTDTITVRGCAADEQPVTSIVVNGVTATSGDGFATWQATVPLSAGDNDLRIESRDSDGNVDGDAARTRVTLARHPLIRPVNIRLDAALGRALVLDPDAEKLVAVDITTGYRTLLSGPDLGAGPSLSLARGGLTHDPAGNAAYVIHQGAIVRIDLGTGERVDISPAGTSPNLNSAEYLALDASAGRLLVSNVFDGQIVAVDIATGARSEFSGPVVGTGPALNNPGEIAIDTASGRALVVTGSPTELVAIDLVTGARSVLASASVGSGPWDFGSTRRVAVDGPRNRAIVTTYLGGTLAYAVDLATGDSALVASPMLGTGPEVEYPVGATMDEAGARLLIVDATADAVFAVDPATGNRSFVSTDAVGSGESFGSVGDPALVLDNQQIHATANSGKSILTIAMPSGDRSLLWTHPMPLPFGSGVYALQWDAASARLLAVDNEISAITAIDPVSAAFTELASATVGSGPPIAPVNDFAIDSTGTRALALQGYCTSEDGPCYVRVLNVDLATGDRSLVSEGNSGVGPFLESGRAVAYDEANNRALVLVRDLPADDSECMPIPTSVVAVDLATGDRSAVTGAGVGSGPPLIDGSGMSFDALPGHVLITYSRSCFGGIYRTREGGVIRVNLATGERTPLVSPDIGAGWPSLGFSAPIAPGAGDYALVTDARGDLLALDLVNLERVVVAR